MYDSSVLLFVAGVLAGVASTLFAVSAWNIVAVLRHLRRMLNRAR